MMLSKLIAVYFEKEEKPKNTFCAGGTKMRGVSGN
jgi:hypothetical protein